MGTKMLTFVQAVFWQTVFFFSGNVKEMLCVSILKIIKSFENLPLLDDFVKK